jgi:methionyl-tRNA formyltransferase
MRIAVIGQAPFGAAVYEKLRENGHEIVGVFTPPEKEGGRSDPLADAARRDGVTLVQPRRWQRKGEVDEAVLTEYEATAPELNVMAFVTQIIPQRVLDFPPQKTIQYHPSLLPKHRGRSAINHALLEGDAETGLTIFWVDEGLDTGPILLLKSFPVGEDDTVNSVYRDHLFPLGVDALAEAVELVASGEAPRIVQNEDDATYEGPWEKDIARIDWSKPAQEVHNLIRGSDRQPGAWTTLHGSTLKVYGSTRAGEDAGAAGSVAAVSEEGVSIRCGDGGLVRVDTVMAEGEKRGAASEWAASAGIDAGTQFE